MHNQIIIESGMIYSAFTFEKKIVKNSDGESEAIWTTESIWNSCVKKV